MSQSLKPLFSGSSVSEYQREQRRSMRKEIKELSSAELESSTDSLALLFASKYTPSEIDLGEPETEEDGVVEKERNLGSGVGLPRGGKVTREMNRVKIKIPYEGRKDLLLKTPSSRRYSPPGYNTLTRRYIVKYVDYNAQQRDADSIKSKLKDEISEWTSKVETGVERLNRDIRDMQEDLEREARRFVEDQRETVEAKNEALEELGISQSNSEQGFAEPEKKKELELPDLEDSNADEQLLRDQTFIDVLDIVDSVGKDLERAKERVRDLDEESLRDIFLTAINTHYGAATGESFNRGGKTDILMRHQGENLFVAECKFWRGESAFEGAVDQLLGNLTARDGHAALLVFSDREGFVEVRDSVETAVKSHEKFVDIAGRFEDHDVYRFEKPAGNKAQVGVKVVDLGA